MAYKVQNFERQYEGMGDDELSRLAADQQDLLQEAGIALRNELSRRGLKTADIEAGRHRQAKHENQLEHRSGERLFRLNYRGVGSARLGKWDHTYDASTGFEEFTTTAFLIFLWLPLIPLGTFRARRKKGVFQRTYVLEKLPLKWNQVLWVWMWMLLVVLAVILLLRFGLR